MATTLNKDVIRESTIKIGDREINITLTSKQEIKMKLKGMKSGEVSISIKELYNQLTGGTESEDEPEEKKGAKSIIKSEKISKKNPMLSLYDLRSQNAISVMDIPTKSKFDGIIKNLIEVNNG